MKCIWSVYRNYIFLVYAIFCCSISYTQDEETRSEASVNISLESEEMVQEELGHVALDSSDHVVQSSFEDTNQEDFSKNFAFTDAISQNSGVSNGILDTGQPIVTTFVDTSKSDLLPQPEITVQETSRNQSTATAFSSPDVNTNDDTKPETPVENVEDTTENNANISEEVPVKQPEKHNIDAELAKEDTKQNASDEEIPSFSEWAQKQLEEAEKKESINTSSHNNGQWNNNNKIRSKNYASPDCGAKVISSNPEAGSPNNVLTPNFDEYILNTCTSRIWFVVELCEPIQAKKIEIGNYELFSSTPKDFTISVSDRYSSREWAVVGQFTAADERKLQAFELQPHFFGRFIKFEMHSHYGSEHFCPITMLKVFGTTEFEVLEKETHSNPIDYDDVDDDDNQDEPASGTFFSSASDAVIKIVNKAREVLGNKGNNSNHTIEQNQPSRNYSPLVNSCTTPSHIVVCNNCSDLLFGCVYELLSCKSILLGDLLRSPLIKNTIYNSDICNSFGIDFRTKRTGHVPNIVSTCIQSFFPPKYLAAFCNTAAIIENQVVLNISKNNIDITNVTNELPPTVSLDNNDNFLEPSIIIEVIEPATELIKEVTESTVDPIVEETAFIPEIKPTKTLTPDEPIDTQQNRTNTDYALEEPKKSTNNVNFENNTQEHQAADLNDDDNVVDIREEVNISTEVDYDYIHSQSDTTTQNPVPHVANVGKESVFIKLSNRIKALERNMSLSSQYLEELSRRYKRQVEEMQKMIDKTISALNDEGASKDLRIQKLEEKINHLVDIVESLATEKNHWLISSYWLMITIVVAFALITFCKRHEFNKNRNSDDVQRRKSIGVISHNAPTVRVRRPSEEAALITGSYQHLMIDIDNVDFKRKLKDRKRKKKRNSVTMVHNGCIGADPEQPDKTWSMQESAPVDLRTNWHDQTSLKNAIHDIPFVLEESDHSPLEGLPLPKPLRDTFDPINNTSLIENLASHTYIQTATQSRSARLPSPDQINSTPTTSKHKFQETHRKSASVDETRRKSPAPSTGNVSLNIEIGLGADAKPVKKPKRLLPFKRMFSRKLQERKE